ncbi:hypothetical protein [Sporosarcina sp. JAI121]|uniref:hypothetical protein n=1 Tax=Sporosarcina sp. JAI121 TaxID=2723064 RepID=UPI0015C74426|nr:hypothetical protein [Sporosarcina sp. JAI121]NYF23560.1 hypothetical protein [Sporosarcina sp. JAI121]
MTSVNSKEIHWFKETLKNVFAVELAADEIGVEATELGLDEVEDFFIPRELFQVVPATLLYEIMIADDNRSNEWVGAVAFYPNLPDWCLQVITKNGKMVSRKLLPLIQ